MADDKCGIGLIGLAVMGSNLVLNMADHGFSVGVFNRTAARTRDFMEREVGSRPIRAGYSIEEFISLLRKPRSILLLVKAGRPVDDVIGELLPYLEEGDLVIDCGNSYFKDTDRRGQRLAEKDLLFIGMGVSGGESGARRGPSMMPGGPEEAYERVKPILEAAAAHVDGEPCVDYMGAGSAGHYVKMVHNGIEYGIMQQIAETYDILKRGLGLSNEELQKIYAAWNAAELNSYLIEITARIFERKDEETGKHLVDLVLDEARQKGTGKWTSWESLELQAAAATIEAAVVARDMSGYKSEREEAARLLPGPRKRYAGDRDDFIAKLESALYGATTITYAQGMALLRKASEAYRYGIHPETVARVWRGGCIIRAALLRDIREAYRTNPNIANLLLDPRMGREVVNRQADLRAVVCAAADLGIPVPGMSASLSYFDTYRSAWLPMNLIQAQRDFFGAHTYQRVDREGTFHTEWEEDES